MHLASILGDARVMVISPGSPSPCSNIIALRSKYKDQFLKKHGVKLGFMSPFVSAAAFALKDQPIVNAGTD